MKRTIPYVYKGHVVLPSCTVCGRSCAVDSFWLYWERRPERTCAELAAVATELLASKARTCEEWTSWMRRAVQRLDQTLWKSPVKDVSSRLIAATMRFIQRHADDDIVGLCQAVETHRPAEGETARILRASRPNDREWPRWAWPETCWVRCEKHRTWCAVGLRKDLYGHHRANREILGAHLIASHSRSCEEFRARQMAATETNWTMRFVPAGHRGRWIRRDQAEEKKITLAYGAASWSALAPALGPWETVATGMLRRGGRN